MAQLVKPPQVENDAFKSAKWDELTCGRSFAQSDAPALALLCQWYAVVERCMEDMDFGEDLPRIAYSNDMGDIKALPQLSTMKQASAEIRALNKQLGINDEGKGEGDGAGAGGSALNIVSFNREKRRAAAQA